MRSKAVSEVNITDDLAFGSRRPKWRIKFLLGSLVLIPVCLAIPFVYFVYSCDRELREAFAQADRLDRLPCRFSRRNLTTKRRSRSF
jgi:hypothetical protein